MEENSIPTTVAETKLVRKPKRDYTMWFVVGGGAAFLVIVVTGVLVGYLMIQSAMKKVPAPTTPTETVQTTPTIIVTPSPWATDAGVLKLRDDLKTLSGKIDTVDLIEPQIAPPAIDLGLAIK